MKCVLTIPTGYNKDEGCPSNRQSSNMHNVKFVFFLNIDYAMNRYIRNEYLRPCSSVKYNRFMQSIFK